MAFIDSPLLTLEDLHSLWSEVLCSAPAHGRSLWLGFLDEDERAHRALTQIDGLGLRPDEAAVSNLGVIVRGIVSDSPMTSGALLCLEREGTSGAAPFEEAWADALTLELGDLIARPIMVRTPGGVAPVRLWSSAA